jgi:hypothetical protein
MQSRSGFRLRHFISIALLVVAACFCAASQAQQKGATPDKPKIRAITAFINLDRAQYKEQVADALKMLKRAQTIFESRGYQVQTIRIATQPFPEYTKGLTTEQAVSFFKEYDALAVKEKFDSKTRRRGRRRHKLKSSRRGGENDKKAGGIHAAQPG